MKTKKPVSKRKKEGLPVDEETIQHHIMDLKVSNAKLCAEVNHLTEAVSSLNSKMDKVTSAIDSNKGAVKVFVGLAGLIGSVLTYLAHRLFGF
jgi:peptidoglycan hydrolase CwlO-like protein